MSGKQKVAKPKFQKQQAEPSSEKEKNFRPNRGRGASRGRARGRGRGQVNRIKTSLPTVDQRISQIKSLQTKEPIVAVPNAPSTEKLSMMMESMYPSSSSVAKPFANVIIDPYGFCNIAERTYLTLIETERKLESLLSYDEYMLVMGWFLARRVLAVRNAVYHNINTSEGLFSSIPITTKIPGPVATCLESLGHVRTPSGLVMVPSVVLPKIDVAHNWQRGLYPSLDNEDYHGDAKREYIPSMFPFWYFKRKIQFEWGNPLSYAPDCLEKENPLEDVKVDAKVDGYLKQTMHIPGIRNQGRVTPSSRLDQQPPYFSMDDESILGSVGFSGTLFGSYLSFSLAAQKYMHFKTFKKESSGTGAMLGWCEHLGRQLANPQFKCFSSYNMNQADMHGVRLFKWRRRVSRDVDPLRGRGVDVVWTHNPAELKTAAREIDYIRNDIVLVHDYVSNFVLRK